jgi:uncharacterized protein (DUF169 family)
MKTELKYLKKITGEHWTGIKFSNRCCGKQKQAGTLCEAIAYSFKESFCLLCREIDCPGALRCLGFTDNDEQLTAHISEEAGAGFSCIRRIIAESPRMVTPVSAVELGEIADPEICVGYISPEAAMKLLRQWQQVFGMRLATALSSFMAICSTVIAAYRDDTLVFSMGCPESRKRGGIASGQMVAALPCKKVALIMQEVSKCRHMNTSVQNAAIALNNSRT